MTLFDLAIKNIQRNMKSYGLYIGSMIFSIVIYFTFVTLKYSNDIMALAGATIKIDSLMNMASIVLLIFVAIFIAYSNSFFMKKRKKEVGLYSLLGVRKRKIGLLLFFENLIIGLLSLIVGIVLGFFLSKLLLTILIRLMGFVDVAPFALSTEAVMNTSIVFLVIFLFTSFQGYFVIYRFKLIDLFHASQKGEDLPRARWISALLGVSMLVGGYWLASQDLFTSEVWRKIGFSAPILILLLTVVGTYLLFHSVLVYVLAKMKNNPRWAWRGLNLMSVSQLLYRIRGNAKTLTIIAILSATTITAGGAVFSLYYNNDQNTKTFLPHTFMWQGEHVAYNNEAIKYYESYDAKELQLEVADATYYFSTIDESTYNRLAKLQDLDAVKLGANEVVVADPGFDERFSPSFLNEQLNLEGHKYTVVAHGTEGVVNAMLTPLTLVVPDATYQALQVADKPYQVMELDNEKGQLAASKELEALVGDTEFSSYPQTYQDSLESLGALLFVGTFLGLVFLVATGSIIYFKMMTEAEEDRAKYQVLHKIGVNDREMNKTIRAQVATVFAVPLVAGLLHSAFALQAFANIFMFDILQPVLIWMAAYIVIYVIYYFATVAYFKKTVKQNVRNEG